MYWHWSHKILILFDYGIIQFPNETHARITHRYLFSITNPIVYSFFFSFEFRTCNFLNLASHCLWKNPVTNLKNNLPKEVKKEVHAIWSMKNIYFSLAYKYEYTRPRDFNSGLVWVQIFCPIFPISLCTSQIKTCHISIYFIKC